MFRTSFRKGGMLAAAFVGSVFMATTPAHAIDTNITYQGVLADNGSNVNGVTNLEFRLFDAASGGSQVGSTVATAPDIVDGLLNADLDFGVDPYVDGQTLWLEVTVEGQPLSRQQLTATPYSLATRGINVDGSGFIGNGTPTPRAPLHITDGGQASNVASVDTNITAIFEDPSDRAGIAILNGFDGGFGRIDFGSPSNLNKAGFSYSHLSDVLTIRNTSGQLRMLENGFVGIGTDNNIDERLEVEGNILASGNVSASSFIGDGSQLTGLPNASPWTLNGSDVHYNGGNVGIGTSSPTNRLAIVDSQNTYGSAVAGRDLVVGSVDARMALASTRGGSDGSFIELTEVLPDGTGDLASSWRIGRRTSNAGDRFQLNWVEPGVNDEVLSVLPNGRVGIGTSTPTSLLDVAGTATVDVLTIDGGADIVEGFESSCEAELTPGTVVVIDSANPGKLKCASGAYDHKVAGVVSGANGVRPGIKLGQEGVLDGDIPVAMTGRVYVKCSTENGVIRAGDRLTTATLAGHAMKATDSTLADGAVIGKAMSELDDETGLVLVLVNLQ